MAVVAKMERIAAPGRILVAAWEELTEEERDQAIEAARQEGRRAARLRLAAEAPSRRRRRSLRRSRWAREHGRLDRVPDDALHLYATAHTLACEHYYVEQVIEAHHPEEAIEWWGMEREERRKDPRVCCFCDGYERERRAILGMPALPTSLADLQLHLWEAKEAERLQARLCLEQIEATGDVSLASPQSIAGWDYRRLSLATELAEMLLDAAALHPGRIERADAP